MLWVGELYTWGMERLFYALAVWVYYGGEARAQGCAGRAGGDGRGMSSAGCDSGCVFCNLIRAVEWGERELGREAAEKAGLVVGRFAWGYCCLNRFPYASGHLLLVPARHTDSLAKLEDADAVGMMREAQRAETALREVYKSDGINLGMNLGAAAGAGVAEHVHLHILPRWVGDTNFMTVVAETRVLPETLDVTWARMRDALSK